MGLSISLFMLMHFLALLSLYNLMFASSSFVQPLCHDDESFALLQFKESFIINQSASYATSAYPKVSSWKLESDDCCSWDGVGCDKDTGHVISLNLSSSCLYGSINSSSSLFRLVNLQRLNLSDNDFNQSQIPVGIRQLSNLTYLDLYDSGFAGQIPAEILQLSKLVYLDLSFNLLKLQNPGLQSLVEKFPNMEELYLSQVDISSTVPNNMANLTSLTSLYLRECGLHGEFPAGIFQLPNLEVLSVRYNADLTGYVPEFNRSSPLKVLMVAGTSFYGELPDSIGDLKLLNSIDVSDCNFSGPVPSSLGNLTELIYLDLSAYNFKSGTLDWIGKQTKLNVLGLANLNLNSSIPFFLRNLTQLRYLNLDYCNLMGHIPSWLANLTQLADLRLGSNGLHGSIPSWISKLMNLERLYLYSNHFGGRVEFDIFMKLQNLFDLQLSSNQISLPTKPSNNMTFPKFQFLGLDSCDLDEFPDFLKCQDELVYLKLSDNKISGLIPKWMWNSSIKTLWNLNLSNNFLTGFHQLPVILPWTNLQYLDLSNNKLQGSLPIPSPSILTYLVSNNTLTGEIPQMICNLSSLVALDLSSNNLSGMLPNCLGNLSFSLSILNLRRNNFHGNIPQICKKGSKLKMIDFSRNQLQGWIPRSLVNCTMLETLVIGNNQLNDSFPAWLGVLPELEVLILRYNQLQGVIGKPESNFVFPNLHIVDFSYNNITGKLPFEYFRIWKAMQIIVKHGQMYMQENMNFIVPKYSGKYHYSYSMTFTNRGIEIAYERIPYIFIAMDLSSNKFEGEIPVLMGDLKGIQLLNLSNNLLTGSIPSSLEKLTALESLDLSQNKLSGEIPPQLTQLTFLAFFNVSNNHLIGPIPHGFQFDTFQDKSFDGNPGLCGSPLPKKCGNFEDSLHTPLNQDSKLLSEFGWKVVVIGYGCGFIIGVIIGQIVIARKYKWFIYLHYAVQHHIGR
ncbi:receptor-like protein 7 isoform X2 [Quercus robur]|uniref:receptor-like protein 7 isoform X2 n=1 Tax=Quercus robur TaxID=38942 RepID=UPI0021623B9D|nr:receptor-like protein 7 isoform X2 [Quercus robur]